MKSEGMLVVSLRGVNFGFWSHLGWSGQNAIIFSRQGLVWGCTRKNLEIYIFNSFYLPPILVSFRGLISTSIPSLSYRSPPLGAIRQPQRKGSLRAHFSYFLSLLLTEKGKQRKQRTYETSAHRLKMGFKFHIVYCMVVRRGKGNQDWTDLIYFVEQKNWSVTIPYCDLLFFNRNFKYRLIWTYEGNRKSNVLFPVAGVL